MDYSSNGVVCLLFQISAFLLMLGAQSTNQFTDSDIERYRYKFTLSLYSAPTVCECVAEFWVMLLNYAGNACDVREAGDLVIGTQTNVGLSKWCMSLAGMPVLL